MTTEHDKIGAALAEYVSTRMAPEQRRSVDEHLSGCPECREVVADLMEIRRQVKDAGEALFEPHPPPEALRQHAEGGGEAAEPWLLRHLQVCVTCRLEAESLGRLRVSGKNVSRPMFRRAWVPWMGSAAAAGIALGFFMALQLPALRQPGPPTGRAPRTSSALGGRLSQADLQPVLRLLPRPLRDGELPTQRWILDPTESSISVGIPITVPASSAGLDRIRFELQRPEEGPVWEEEMTVSRIQQHLDSAGVVYLVIRPTRALAAGVYEFRALPASSQGGSPVYQATIELSYRQSPAATNAPQ